MKFYSTNNRNNIVGFEKAVMSGLADDSGLYMPCSFPNLKSLVASIEGLSFQEISYDVIKNFVQEEIPPGSLKNIIEQSINFPAPVSGLDNQLGILELFHGPTLAFKDFGARFMAQTMGYFVRNEETELNILVATSGDTGSAVANGFYGVEGINVFILYPSGKVSPIQEKQLTTLDKNVHTLEIIGTFDDCQRLVKEAFVDQELLKKIRLSSANSINIARLLPQSFYYFEAFKQLPSNGKKILYCVPSGNLGNLTAGLFAKMMGLPISNFIAATNSNNVFTDYLKTGKFMKRKSVQTLSNAMDVGNPSNLVRIIDMYKNNIENVSNDILSFSHNDRETVEAIKEVYMKYGYVIDPHGAVGYLAAKKYLESTDQSSFVLILETAHASKFKDIVENSIDKEIEIPARLASCLNEEKKSVILSSDYNDFKEFLLYFR